MDQNTNDAVITPIAEPAYYTVRHRARFNRDNAGLLRFLIVAVTILIAMLWFFIFVQFGTRIPPLHFPMTSEMQIIQPEPLDQEGISKPALLNWVTQMSTTMFSFNYSNIDKQQSKLMKYFSDNALKQYSDMLQYDNDFNVVIPKQYVVSIRPLATPEITNSKAYLGRYAWQVHAVARISFSNAAMHESQDVALDFLIMRVPVEQAPLGIIVQTFNRTVLGRVAAQKVKTGL